nr:hypothetical protein LTR18_007117 [Exophiala xenobiotica]
MLEQMRADGNRHQSTKLRAAVEVVIFSLQREQHRLEALYLSYGTYRDPVVSTGQAGTNRFRRVRGSSSPETKIANVATIEDLLRAKFFIHFCINHWDKWPKVTRPPLEAREVPYLKPEEVVQVESKGKPFLTKRPSQPSGAETQYEDVEADAMDFDVDMEAIKNLQDRDPERYSRLQDHTLSSLDRMALNRKQMSGPIRAKFGNFMLPCMQTSDTEDWGDNEMAQTNIARTTYIYIIGGVWAEASKGAPAKRERTSGLMKDMLSNCNQTSPTMGQCTNEKLENTNAETNMIAPYQPVNQTAHVSDTNGAVATSEPSDDARTFTTAKVSDKTGKKVTNQLTDPENPLVEGSIAVSVDSHSTADIDLLEKLLSSRVAKDLE